MAKYYAGWNYSLQYYILVWSEYMYRIFLSKGNRNTRVSIQTDVRHIFPALRRNDTPMTSKTDNFWRINYFHTYNKRVFISRRTSNYLIYFILTYEIRSNILHNDSIVRNSPGYKRSKESQAVSCAADWRCVLLHDRCYRLQKCQVTWHIVDGQCVYITHVLHWFLRGSL